MPLDHRYAGHSYTRLLARRQLHRDAPPGTHGGGGGGGPGAVRLRAGDGEQGAGPVCSCQPLGAQVAALAVAVAVALVLCVCVLAMVSRGSLGSGCKQKHMLASGRVSS